MTDERDPDEQVDARKWYVDKDGVFHVPRAVRIDTAALNFIMQRLVRASPADVEDVWNRAVLDIIFDENMSLDSSPSLRTYIGNELLRRWVMTPREHQVAEGRARRNNRASFLQALVDGMRRHLEMLTGRKVSEEKAMKKIEEYGAFGKFETIKQALKPSRIAGKEYPKKTAPKAAPPEDSDWHQDETGRSRTKSSAPPPKQTTSAKK